MTIKLARTQAEIMLRAIRDHLADSITTLPMLIKHQLKNESSASLHFYFGNMTAMRKHLAPSLVEAYEVWHETGDISKLQALSDNLSSHWENIAVEVKSLYITSNKPEPIEDLIKSKKL
jgi:hypothetical protein